MTFARASLYSLALLALGSLAQAQEDNASYDQVAAIQLNFPAAGITPEYFPEEWLDIQGVLNVTFGDVNVGNIGDRLSVEQVQTAPTYRISAETKRADDSDVFDSDNGRFTVAFLDTFVAGQQNGGVVNIHYLGNNYTAANEGRLENRTAAAVEYAAPNPPANDGPHRYVQLVFRQFDNFTAPTLDFQGSPGINQSFTDYYKSANGGLGKIVAANYIQIEVGNAAAPSSTAPVAQSSVAALAAQKSSADARPSSTGSSSSGTRAASPSNTGNSTSGSRDGTSGALSVGAAPLTAMAGMVGAAVLGALLL